MVARSQATHSDISILIDPETILLPDIFTTLTYIHKLNLDWFLFSTTQNISYFPYQLVDNGIWVQEDGKKIESKKLQEILVHKWTKSASGQKLLMAWNSGESPLHAGILPPFLYGKCFHEFWIINEVLSSEMRLVFDASNVLFSFYPESLGKFSSNYSGDSNIGNERIWEHEGNSRLAALYGSLHFQNANPPNALFKILKCSGHYYFLNEAKGTVQEATRSQLLGGSLNSRHRNWKVCANEINSMKKENPCSLSQLPKLDLEMPVTLKLPFSLESLLEIVADRDKNVVLGIAGASYRDMLMSWACRLRHLGVSNILICALDSETYEFSVLQGLPVFMDSMSPRNVSFDDCHFGTECFQRVTKVKSRIVLQILKLGYNVLLSDVDVYWFNNPLPYLLSFGPGTLVAQSDEYNETGPINIPRRLNSGFYFVRSGLATIAAMEMVVKHASTSGLSEQPSFYDVLCGEGGVNRVGNDQCYEPKTNLTVFFLDRNFFPNGAYMGFWEKPDVRSACLRAGCFILHNNWINGRKRKLERQIQSGLWDYDPSTRLCIQSWHNYT
ncbi:beta-arabinofuranosyltransferase RAY1 [Ananas comosus]|uniref:Beta-arabinofuranosyltransferase RAY1 n=1 Tax=Ananas comosus TaxID=4615 RepID=A0A6P5FYD0_ANACO|nr:beta-arabinofuranosyltransferase RAY1 [Ananas comosus]XP_020098504.1 beta-arabinofuranosyltransferase RAY1 [Ananas comosus]